MGDSTKAIKRNPSAVAEKSQFSSRLQKLKTNMKTLDINRTTKDASKSADSSEALEELVQCGICLDRLSDPKMLPCQHTFCLSCLQKHLSAEAGRALKKKHTPPSPQEIEVEVKKNVEIKCPTCQSICAVGRGMDGLHELPNNLYIDSLLNLLTSGHSSPKTPLMLTPTKIGIETRCVRCQTFCQFEEKRCQHCVQIFCKVCWTEHMSELKRNLFSLVNQLTQTETKLENKIDEFDQKCLNVEVKIKSLVESKIQEIRTEEQEALTNCETSRATEKNSANNLKSKIENVKKEIRKLEFDNIENDIQKVITFVNFHRTTSSLIDQVDKWGELNIQLAGGPNLGNVSSDFLTPKTDVVTTVPVKDIELFEFEFEYKNRSFAPKLIWNKCPRPAGVAVAPWASNILYIATSDNKSVLIMDKTKSKVIGKLSAEGMGCPYGVACSNTKGEIYVTDKWNHCIHVFSSTGDYIKALSSKGNAEGKLLCPEGIAVCPSNDLVVCDTGNDRVVILNPDDGYQILSLGKVDKRTELQSPTGVVVHRNKIIVADSGNHRVKIFSVIGEKISEFGNKSQFQSLDAIACDPDGVILVGDGGSGRLKIFSTEGQLIRVVGSSQNSVKFATISGIAVTPDRDIVITDSKSRKLQIT